MAATAAALGLQDLSRSRVAFLRAGSMRLELVETRDSQPATARPAPPGHNTVRGLSQIAFYVGDLDAILTSLSGHGITPVMDPVQVDALGIRSAFVQDPDSTLIELLQVFPDSPIRGEPLLAPAVLAKVVARAVRAHHDDTTEARAAVDREELAMLSPRQREVLALLGAGHSNAEIGARLHLGVTTVKSHVAAVTDRLSLRDRVQAAVRAHRLGLVDNDFLRSTRSSPARCGDGCYR